MAHDFGNFAIALRSYASVLNTQITHPSRLTSEALDGIEEIAQSAQSMTGSLLRFAREEIHQPDRGRSTDLCAIARSSVAALRPVAGSANPIEASIPEGPLLIPLGDTDVKRMISNLVLNSIDASTDPTPIRLIVEHDRQHAHLIVRDFGEGMPPEIQKRIFDPYFTTKTKGKGTGLGLAVIAGMVYDNGGEIEVDSIPQEGTTIAITMPIIRETDA